MGSASEDGPSMLRLNLPDALSTSRIHADRLSMREFQDSAVTEVRALADELSRAIRLSSGAIAVTR